jgi:uncharacterized membrane protein
MDFIKPLIIAIILFVIFDFIFFSLIAKKFYKEQLGSSMLDTPRLSYAVIVYILLALGMVMFILPSNYNIWLAGAAFGLIVYGVYDFTNYIFLKSWTLPVVWLDVAWGTIATSFVAFLTRTIQAKFL